jgi:DNA repair photolyase
MDVLREGKDFDVGFSVTTADDKMRRLFEPKAPPIGERIRALDELHKAGIRTYAMIAPMLPGAESLPEAIVGKVDYILVDRMNYNYGDWVYRKYGLEDKMTDDFFYTTRREISSGCERLSIDCRVVY